MADLSAPCDRDIRPLTMSLPPRPTFRAAGATAPRRSTRLPVNSYSNTEWEANRAIITHLYSVERQPLAEVRRRLREMGFQVNERMLHTRIRRWKLGRNHKFPEMRAAAYLLAEHLDQHLRGGHRDVGTTSRDRPVGFLIRGEEVSYAEFRRYFRRKKISDPVAWIRDQGNEDLMPSKDVKLVTSTATPESDSEETEELGHDPALVGREAEPRVDLTRVPPPEETEDFPDHLDHSEWDAFPAHPADCPSWQQDTQYHDPSQSSTAVTHLQKSPMPASSALAPVLLRPHAFRAMEQVNYSMSTYISSYMASARSLRHTEPTVHAYTVHALFASKMADGMALLERISRPSTSTTASAPAVSMSSQPQRPQQMAISHHDQTVAQAFDNFQNGFELVRTILTDDHPMSLALMLGTVCELISHTAVIREHDQSSADKAVTLFWTVTTQLLWYIREMATLLLGNGHALTAFFAVLAEEAVSLSQSLDDHSTSPKHNDGWAASEAQLKMANLIVNTLRVATGQYLASATSAGAHDWKTLYLRERFCDSLYHSGPSFAHERAQQRRLLLRDQEHFYSPTARNVLYTLTNVADDALEHGDVVDAIDYFKEVLTRAEVLTDYGRAKTRFAALEGLAGCFVAQAEALRTTMVEAEIMRETQIPPEVSIESGLETEVRSAIQGAWAPGVNTQTQAQSQDGWNLQLQAQLDEQYTLAEESGFDYAAPEVKTGTGSGPGDINTDHHGEAALGQSNTNALLSVPLKRLAEITNVPVTTTANSFACACDCAYQSHGHGHGRIQSHPHSHSHSKEPSRPSYSGQSSHVGTGTATPSTSSSSSSSSSRSASLNEKFPDRFSYSFQGGYSRTGLDSGQSGSAQCQQQGLPFMDDYTGIETPTQVRIQNLNQSRAEKLHQRGTPESFLPLRQYSPRPADGPAELAVGVAYFSHPRLPISDDEEEREGKRRQLERERRLQREKELLERERELQRRKELLDQERDQLERVKEREKLIERERQRQDHLRQALVYFCAAEAEARVWFDPTSRRTARARAKIDEIRESLSLNLTERER